MVESGDRHRNDMVLKLKETEKRLYETVQEKQDMESRLRASQKTLEDI